MAGEDRGEGAAEAGEEAQGAAWSIYTCSVSLRRFREVEALGGQPAHSIARLEF